MIFLFAATKTPKCTKIKKSDTDISRRADGTIHVYRKLFVPKPFIYISRANKNIHVIMKLAYGSIHMFGVNFHT